MYYVGIDISKYKHDCFIATESGAVIKNSFSFNNDYHGFNHFLSVLKSLDSSQDLRIGLEATGHYGTNLKMFLYDNNYSFMELNPLLSERFRQVTSLRKTKTDKLDSEMISKMLLTLPYKPYSTKSYHILSLKSLTRLRFNMVVERTKYKVRLKNHMDLVFPEYFNFFTNPYGSTSMYFLTNYKNPINLVKVAIDKLYTDVYQISRGHFSYAKLVKLYETAKNSIGKSNDILDFQLDSILSTITFYNQQISDLEAKIEHIMKQYNFYTTTIKGIGMISAASIVSEYGDFSLFSSPAKMLSFAGLEPAIYQSGTSTTYGKMVKRGSSHLRYVIMNSAETVIIHNPLFYTYYHKKRNEGKVHRVALTHVARKLIRLIFTLETKQVEYNASLLK
jgi:transposase